MGLLLKNREFVGKGYIQEQNVYRQVCIEEAHKLDELPYFGKTNVSGPINKSALQTSHFDDQQGRSRYADKVG